MRKALQCSILILFLWLTSLFNVQTNISTWDSYMWWSFLFQPIALNKVIKSISTCWDQFLCAFIVFRRSWRLNRPSLRRSWRRRQRSWNLVCSAAFGCMIQALTAAAPATSTFSGFWVATVLSCVRTSSPSHACLLHLPPRHRPWPSQTGRMLALPTVVTQGEH